MKFIPAYIKTYEERKIKDKIEQALQLLKNQCKVCPRRCKVDRYNNKFGVCKIGRYAKVSSASPHFGEEDVLRGWRGSGTIFFSGCNLKCVFCQNYDISWLNDGYEVTPKELANLMIRLQEMGCHNINFVTPEHVVPQIIESLPFAIEKNLNIPIVYNTSSYDGPDSLKLMDGIVDIYMPDFKFWSEENSLKYLKAKDYPQVAKESIKQMHLQTGDLIIDENGVAQRGVLVRYLVMPNHLDETKQIMNFLAGISKNMYVNIMDQYRPCWYANKYPKINRPITSQEYRVAFEYAQKSGLNRFDKKFRKVIMYF